uniref:Mitochondrial fission process protein 1 n=1 Tax=Oncorhynchus kisutch TaxID=8019 RepID=A0A8C7HQE7_ONCKI
MYPPLYGRALLHSYLTLACNLVLTGYANEVGEAFRALAPVSAVWATRAVATEYVSADALDKGKKAAVVRKDFFVKAKLYGLLERQVN